MSNEDTSNLGSHCRGHYLQWNPLDKGLWKNDMSLRDRTTDHVLQKNYRHRSEGPFVSVGPIERLGGEQRRPGSRTRKVRGSTLANSPGFYCGGTSTKVDDGGKRLTSVVMTPQCSDVLAPYTILGEVHGGKAILWNAAARRDHAGRHDRVE